MRSIYLKLALVVFAGVMLLGCSKKENWIELMSEPNLASWRQDRGDWFEAGKAFMDPDNEKLIATEPGHGVAVNGKCMISFFAHLALTKTGARRQMQSLSRSCKMVR